MRRLTLARGRRLRGFESLEPRRFLAVTAQFSAATGILSVFGDSGDNSIEISRTAGGGIQVNGGAVSVVGGSPTVANTALIQAFGLSGNDVISVNEANGALPAANLYGGAGDDTLIGGSGADRLFGQGGQDSLLGKGGFDFLFGGSEGDMLLGGDGDDQAFGQSGDDEMVWNPGDDTDLDEGGSGVDKVVVNGGNGAETFSVVANGSRVRFDRLDPAPFALDIGTTEGLTLNANGGNDTFTAAGNLAALIQLTVDGGAGNDTLSGSNGADVLIGGDDDDLVDGNQGNDLIFLGAGNDRFNWDPGDGSDVVEGQAGLDELIFNGSSANEIFDLAANGGRLRFARNVGNIVLDLDDVEKVSLTAASGTDTVVVNNLAGTDVTLINIGLAGTAGSMGDASADSIIVNATSGDDVVIVSGDAGGTTVLGLAATINVFVAETALDRLTVNLLGGNDVLDASGLAANGIALTGDGGDDDDVLTGGDGNDTLLGGLGDDVLLGGPGVDILDGGPGDNIIIQ